MNKERNIEAAKAVFEKDSLVKELYFTSDGQAFYHSGPAGVHQKELTGKSDGIHRVKNAMHAGAEESLVEDIAAADTKEAPTNGVAKKKGKSVEQ
jgi:hypothetical protein